MKTNGEISVWKNGQFAQILHNNNFIRLLYLVTFTADKGLLSAIDYYFMVELETIPRFYKFLTFFSQTICNYK